MGEQVKGRLKLNKVLGKSRWDINDSAGGKERVYIKIQCSIFNCRKNTNLKEITPKMVQGIYEINHSLTGLGPNEIWAIHYRNKTKLLQALGNLYILYQTMFWMTGPTNAAKHIWFNPQIKPCSLHPIWPLYLQAAHIRSCPLTFRVAHHATASCFSLKTLNTLTHCTFWPSSLSQ